VQVVFYAVGTAQHRYLRDGIALYADRVARFIPFSYEEIPIRRSGRGVPERIREEESVELLRRLRPQDRFVLLDERGRELTSRQFADFLDRRLSQGAEKRLVFAAGGAYGVSEEVRRRADDILALSKMTLPHDLVRVVFLEQLYRVCDILRGGPYHH